jgi:NADPH-dependent curcumin reductase CurA
MHIGKPKKGECAFVSGAAGATGFCAVQILKKLGLDVIGCAGDDKKIKMLESFGVKAFNYKKEKPLDALLRLCPNGLDLYFDNVVRPQHRHYHYLSLRDHQN